MVYIDTQTLMAYADGELEPEDRRLVEQELVRQPPLRRQLEQLGRLDGWLSEAFSTALPGRLSEVAAAPPRVGFWQSRRWLSLDGWQGLGSVWQGGAAVALLLTGFVVGGWYGDRSQRLEQLAYQQQLQQAIDNALETRLSGDPLHWGDGLGSVTPVRTYRSKGGLFCREFIDRRQRGELADLQRGVACRDAQGWRMKASYYL